MNKLGRNYANLFISHALIAIMLYLYVQACLKRPNLNCWACKGFCQHPLLSGSVRKKFWPKAFLAKKYGEIRLT